jgi:hypothetical protein
LPVKLLPSLFLVSHLGVYVTANGKSSIVHTSKISMTLFLLFLIKNSAVTDKVIILTI